MDSNIHSYLNKHADIYTDIYADADVFADGLLQRVNGRWKLWSDSNVDKHCHTYADGQPVSYIYCDSDGRSVALYSGKS